MKTKLTKQGRVYFIFFWVALASAVIAAVWQTLLYLFAYDNEKMFFAKIPAVYLFAAFILIQVMACAFISLMPSLRRMNGSKPSEPKGQTLASALCGFFLIAMVVMQIIIRLNKDLGDDLGKYSGTLHVVSLVLAIPASMYFLYTIFTDKPSEKLRIAFGLCLSLWGIVCLLVTHLYLETPINSPIRIGSLLTFAAMTLFFVEELRFGFSKPLPNVYVALGFLTAILAAGDSFPILFLSIFKLGGFALNLATIYYCFEASVAAYAILRMAGYLFAPSFRPATAEGKSAPAKVESETK